GAALLGSSLTLLGMVLLAVLPLAAPSDVIPGLVLIGAGLGFSSPAAQSSSMSDAPVEQSGMAAGVGSTARYLGGVGGIAIMSALADGGDPLARHRLAATIFCGALVLSIGCASLLRAAP